MLTEPVDNRTFTAVATIRPLYEFEKPHRLTELLMVDPCCSCICCSCCCSMSLLNWLVSVGTAGRLARLGSTFSSCSHFSVPFIYGVHQ
jgi:hypothetical protein